MYIKFIELKLTRTIHHVESERNYSTTFSNVSRYGIFSIVPEFFDSELFGSYLTAVPEPLDVNSRFARPVIFIALYTIAKSLSAITRREGYYDKRASACNYQSRVRNNDK